MAAPRDFPLTLERINLFVLMERACEYYRKRVAGIQILCTPVTPAPLAWSDRVVTITGERFERRLAEELATFRVALVREIHDVRVDVLRWMFAFWVGQFFAFAGLLAFFMSRATIR